MQEITESETRLDERSEELIGRLRAKAENLYLTRQLLCSEAVLFVLNRALNGGLSDESAIRLASPLAVGMGDAGCTCGALTGAEMAVGLFLGREKPAGRGSRRARGAGRLMHDRFRDKAGSTCCRVLTRKVKQDKKAHFRQCSGFTGQALEGAARIILSARPGLVAEADLDFLAQRDSTARAGLKRLAGAMRG